VVSRPDSSLPNCRSPFVSCRALRPPGAAADKWPFHGIRSSCPGDLRFIPATSFYTPARLVLGRQWKTSKLSARGGSIPATRQSGQGLNGSRRGAETLEGKRCRPDGRHRRRQRRDSAPVGPRQQGILGYQRKRLVAEPIEEQNPCDFHGRRKVRRGYSAQIVARGLCPGRSKQHRAGKRKYGKHPQCRPVARAIHPWSRFSSHRGSGSAFPGSLIT